jgi:hypothetical protein
MDERREMHVAYEVSQAGFGGYIPPYKQAGPLASGCSLPPTGAAVSLGSSPGTRGDMLALLQGLCVASVRLSVDVGLNTITKPSIQGVF